MPHSLNLRRGRAPHQIASHASVRKRDNGHATGPPPPTLPPDSRCARWHTTAFRRTPNQPKRERDTEGVPATLRLIVDVSERRCHAQRRFGAEVDRLFARADRHIRQALPRSSWPCATPFHQRLHLRAGCTGHARCPFAPRAQHPTPQLLRHLRLRLRLRARHAGDVHSAKHAACSASLTDGASKPGGGVVGGLGEGGRLWRSWGCKCGACSFRCRSEGGRRLRGRAPS